MGRYASYLPEVIATYQELIRMGQMEDVILDEMQHAKEILIQNQWILSADRAGLLHFGRFVGFYTLPESLEEARALVLYHWNGCAPYTYRHLLEWLDGYCGGGQYESVLHHEAYRLVVTLSLQIKEKQPLLSKRLREMVPANLVLDVLLDYNTHGRLHGHTHGALRTWKQRELFDCYLG